jgi:hypothetical protein
MPRRRTKPTKRNPLLDMPADQLWNTRGSVVWSNKIVVCPRCGKESRLTLAASLRSDWELSLTCCPLPVTRRKAPTAEDEPQQIDGSDASSAGPLESEATSEAPTETVEPADATEAGSESDTPPGPQERYLRRDQPHDAADDGETSAA